MSDEKKTKRVRSSGTPGSSLTKSYGVSSHESEPFAFCLTLLCCAITFALGGALGYSHAQSKYESIVRSFAEPQPYLIPHDCPKPDTIFVTKSCPKPDRDTISIRIPESHGKPVDVTVSTDDGPVSHAECHDDDANGRRCLSR